MEQVKEREQGLATERDTADTRAAKLTGQARQEVINALQLVE
jgi:hypothetical protein